MSDNVGIVLTIITLGFVAWITIYCLRIWKEKVGRVEEQLHDISKSLKRIADRLDSTEKRE